MPEIGDKREFTRVHIQVEVETDEENVRTMQGSTNDISIGGFFVETKDKLEVGYEGKMELLLDGGLEKVPIEVQGKVVRANDDGYGIEIVKVYGVNSYSHLKRLVLYNAEDLSKVQSEIDQHSGIRPLATQGQITIIE